jgi:hypothetical protein
MSGEISGPVFGEPAGQSVRGTARHCIKAADWATICKTARHKTWRVGRSRAAARCVRRGANRPPIKEETPQACAARFVEWLLRRYPDTASLWIAARDIRDHLLDGFQGECGGLGSYVWMARGLSKVIDGKRVSDFIDCDGDRRCMTEYRVPAAAVVGGCGDRRQPGAFALALENRFWRRGG